MKTHRLLVSSQTHKKAEEPLDLRFTLHVDIAVKVLFQSRWRPQILCAMLSGPIRLSTLVRLLPSAPKKSLVHSLRELAVAGIIYRRDLSTTVLHVEYEINENVRTSLFELLDRLASFGRVHLARPRQD